MSQSDSFIEEVTEEVRRDRFFRFIRRWWWVALAVVLIVVGGAAWNEWRKARDAAEAQAFGDAIVTALDADTAEARAAALAEIEAEGGRAALVDLLRAAEAPGDAATAPLAAVAGAESLEPRWQELARLKLVLAEDAMSPEERIAALEPMTAAGAPYRLLAFEAIALAHAQAGETEQAVAVLRDALADQQVSEGLRARVSQLMVALQGAPEPE
ncbi:hypothetical protein [Roseitranquillus sediminis]|uniref:hypothetical protein n=1 Tax=Roseitranquillus sediminis TaxID=2809051 RepID=UPI001D0C272D|nr:hypothetical protein [Roseitranquillus sediminis]MBM9594356.1 hypothetical protein [Roseitranquillus sediminis]